jgi:4-amino-4-deoxychorismate lyase
MKITLDEGYQFGLGVFETIAVEHGNPLLLDWHLERLQTSAGFLRIDRTVSAKEVFQYLEGKETTHHALKIMLSGENKLFTLRENPYSAERLQKGFSLGYSTVYRNETSPLVCHKTMNYGDCILEKRRCLALGLDELIFRNSRGEICEGTATNLFFVRDGKLFTPSAACGLLPGVMRRFILEHFPVTEGRFTKDDICSAEECFVTNSLMGIMPVNELGEKTFQRGPVTAMCARAAAHLFSGSLKYLGDI